MTSNLRMCFIQLISVFLLTACSPADKDKPRWYKGNLHTHSYWSDGDEYPEMIMNWYKTHGYDFVALSDHNILAEGEKRVKVTKSRMYEEGFEKYLAKYGKDWVSYTVDSGRTTVKLKTYQEYKPLFEDETFLIIQSEEITSRFEGKPVHMNATNVQILIPPQGGESVTDVMQRNVDAVMKQRNETGTPMFPHINHPNLNYGVSVQDIIDLHGERFFEVYNGHPLVRNYGDTLHLGTEVMWDLINTAYARKGQPLLFGLATDDTHNYHQFGSAFSNAGRGWVMVWTNSLATSSLISALEEGSFYSSTGVLLEEVDFENNALHLLVKTEPGVAYKIEFIGVMMGEDQPQVLKTVMGADARFEVTADHLFVRARVTSDKVKTNPFQEGEFEMAWAQPVSKYPVNN